MQVVRCNGYDIPTISLPKRVRFSLRALLFTILICAVAAYWHISRPTILANRFVAAVDQHDFASATSLFDGETTWALDRGFHRTAVIDHIYAELLPRGWSGIWSGTRQIIFRVAYHEDDDGRHVEWTSDTDIVARPTGLCASDLDRRAILSLRQ